MSSSCFLRLGQSTMTAEVLPIDDYSAIHVQYILHSLCIPMISGDAAHIRMICNKMLGGNSDTLLVQDKQSKTTTAVKIDIENNLFSISQFDMAEQSSTRIDLTGSYDENKKALHSILRYFTLMDETFSQLHNITKYVDKGEPLKRIKTCPTCHGEGTIITQDDNAMYTIRA